MFCDQTQITVTAGKGGDGLMSFRREKYVPKGGPDGGDGGRGGDIIIRVDENLDTLVELHTKKKFVAKNGESGGIKNKHGASSDDLVIRVPVGTQIFNTRTGNLMADMEAHGDECAVAVGGRGGYGNAHFTSSIRQTPRFAELGEPGESVDLKLELKLVADVGIIGLPSAGKSTLISAITAAKPKIGNFPFTTLIPNLGVAKLSGERSLIFCDMPGLIEDASEGKGLGHKFLQHVSRNRVLIHLIDISADDLTTNYKTIRKELEKYDAHLLEKPEIIVLSKADLLRKDEDLKKMVAKEFAKSIGVNAKKILILSSATGEGVRELLEKAHAATLAEKNKQREENPQAHRERILFQPHFIKNPKAFTITPEKDGFRILGKRIQQIVIMSDFTNHEAILRVRDVLRKMGIESKLLNLGATQGTPLYFGEKMLEFQPNILGKKNKKE